MKLKFWTIKKKTIIAILLRIIAIGVFCGAYFPIKASTSPKPLHTIVIDAGHGGADVKLGQYNFENKNKSISIDMPI